MSNFVFKSDEKYPPIIESGTAAAPAANAILCDNVPPGARFLAFAEDTIFIMGVPHTAIYPTNVYVDTSNQLRNGFASFGNVYWRVYAY